MLVTMLIGPKTKVQDLRPIAQVRVAGKDLSALFDTGSVLTLVNSKFKNSILKTGGISCADPDVKLCGANGTALETAGSCKAKKYLQPHYFQLSTFQHNPHQKY